MLSPLRRAALCLLGILSSCATERIESQPPEDPWIELRGETRREMERLLNAPVEGVHWVETGPFVIAAHVDPKTAARIERYAGTLHAELAPLFRPPTRAIRVYVFDAHAPLEALAGKICGADAPKAPNLGFHHPATRSSFCSMEWGLGWLGDILIRSLLNDDWADLPKRPNPWFARSLVSMLYNSFRTAEGDFKGLNVVSYYRPQVQAFITSGRILPFRKFMTADYDESKLPEDFVRKQGREILAYLLARDQLAPFYRALKETCDEDPSGITALEQVLRCRIETVEGDWSHWMLASDGEIGASEMAKPFPVLGILMEAELPERTEEGVIVTLARPDSPGFRSGLREGDRIIQMDGQPVRKRQNLIDKLQSLPLGARLRIAIIRAGIPLELTVTLDRFIDG